MVVEAQGMGWTSIRATVRVRSAEDVLLESLRVADQPPDRSLRRLSREGNMSKKTTGIDDLIKTLIKQHGLTKAIDVARAQVRDIDDLSRNSIWRITLTRLKDML
jgi:hypothetical protein